MLSFAISTSDSILFGLLLRSVFWDEAEGWEGSFRVCLLDALGGEKGERGGCVPLGSEAMAAADLEVMVRRVVRCRNIDLKIEI